MKRMIGKSIRDNDISVGISDQKVIEKYTNDPDFPFLVSFPRTGSHWLRMLMELYFERPSLVRVFYYPERTNYLALHTHDLDLDVYRKNVIYLYRDPIPTIFSQMTYEEAHLNDRDRITYWTSLYCKHLRKWLTEEKFSERKTLIRYENMWRDLPDEFSKITTHFEMTLDSDRLIAAVNCVTKEEVKKKTDHDSKVINLGSSYEQKRREFADTYGNMITSLIFEVTPELRFFFKS